MRKIWLSISIAFASSALANPQPQTVEIAAIAETAPVKSRKDAADDPAIWRNPTDPAKSLIIGTDKKAGIYVYDLKGQSLSFTRSPRPNNIDLRSKVMINGQSRVLVAASDRKSIKQANVALFFLDTQQARLIKMGRLPVGLGEAYGLCLWQASESIIYGFMVLKDGRIDQFQIDTSTDRPAVRFIRSLKLSSQSEGCTVDDRTGQVYVAEENVGIWQFDASPNASPTPTRIASVDGQWLTADVEGLALAPIGAKGGYLVASSQGDNAFVLFRLQDMQPVGRFRLGNAAVDGVSKTDGIEIALGDFGGDYPGGLMVVQDGDNAPDAQNFKLLPWHNIINALELPKGQ
jgi:myo-inositol-hexaphosphate 3-phosphohydrolase